MEDFDGYDAFVLGVLGEEYGGHASAAELTIYGICAGEGVAEFIGGCCGSSWHLVYDGLAV